MLSWFLTLIGDGQRIHTNKNSHPHRCTTSPMANSVRVTKALAADQ